MKSNIFIVILLVFAFQYSKAQCNGPNNPCSICNISATITSISGGDIVDGNSAINGTLSLGGAATGDFFEVNSQDCGGLVLTVDIQFDWQNGILRDWVHGVSFSGSDGWVAAAGVIPGTDWLSLDSIKGCCSNNTYGEGYYFEHPDPAATSNCCGTMDPLSPADNYGAKKDPGLYTFELTYCAQSNEVQGIENIVFNITEDGESGGWGATDGCNYEFTFPIKINSAGLDLPDELGPLCNDECVILDAGLGCNNYLWSTGEVTRSIEVCPLETSTFTVTVSDGVTCEQVDSTIVLVEYCCDADAGDITSPLTSTCPGGEITINVANYYNDPEYSQYILVVNNAGVIEKVVRRNSHTVRSATCSKYTIYSYNIETSGRGTTPVVGMNISDIDCSIDYHCCDLQSILIAFEDSESPLFLNPPADITLNCLDLVPNNDGLEWRDNCSNGGTVIAIETGSGNLCSGGNMTRTWTASDDCSNSTSHKQNITVTPNPQATFQNIPLDVTISCDQSTPNPALSYSNGLGGSCSISGSIGPTTSNIDKLCGGSVTNYWEFTDDCGRMISHTQNIIVEPAPEAAFINSPNDITVSCSVDLDDNKQLRYSNSAQNVCLIQGAVTPIRTGTANLCGAEISYSWSYTDNCNRTISHTQNVTIEPTSAPEFINPPADITVECSQIPQGTPQLEYSNNEPSSCLITGLVDPSITENYNSCGGEIIYHWEFIDQCGNEINYTQQIKILPIKDAVFINLPDDIQLSCGEYVPAPTILSYSNSEAGDCAVDGVSSATTETLDTKITYTYSYENQCSGSIIEYVQTIFIPQVPDIILDTNTDSICQGEEFNLIDIPVFELNNLSPTISYHHAIPPSDQNKLGDLLVSPTQTTSYYVLATSSDGCTDIEEFLLHILTPANAGEDKNGYLCFGSNNINLIDYLTNADRNDGEWTELSSSGIDISDPSNINFSNQTAGLFEFKYTLSSNGCPDDFAIIQLELGEELAGDITLVECSSDRSSFKVEFNANGNDIATNIGSISGPLMDIYTISDIPLNNDLIITFSTGQDNCTETITITPPDCDCPNVLPPVSLGDKSICYGMPTPSLVVEVGSDEIAVWYDSPTGGQIIQSNALTYTPSSNDPGIYTYYVQAESTTEIGCTSATRTPIILQINNLPETQSTNLEACTENGGSFAAFDLTTAEIKLTSQVGHAFEYYLNRIDAENQITSIQNPFVSTSNPQIVFVRITNTSDCYTIEELTLNSNIQPTISVDLSHETCLGLTDGNCTINSSSDNSPINYRLNTTPFGNSEVFNHLSANNYTAYVTDAKSCSDSMEFIINPGLELSIDILQEECNDNGTESDNTDDYYDLNFLINNNLGLSGQFELLIGSNSLGLFNYGDQHLIQLSADNSSPIVSFIGFMSSCSIQKEIGPLAPCSTQCELTLNSITNDCNDNGTPLDPSDDFYTISINVSALNGSSNNEFNLFIDNNLLAAFIYDQDISFDLPVNSDPTNLLIEDASDPQCNIIETIDPLISCSNDCILEATITNIECLDNSTVNDNSDDLFSFEIEANATNGSNRWFIENLIDTIVYGTNQSYGTFTISGGLLTYTIIDSENSDCTATVEVTPPAPCSSPCNIEIKDLVINDCIDNNTGNNNLDDYFSVEFSVNSITGPTTQYNVTDGNLTWGPFSYNTPIVIDQLPADGNTITLDIIDITSSHCTKSIDVMQSSCSSCTQSVDAGVTQILNCTISEVTLNGSSSHSGSVKWTGPNGFTENFLIVNVSDQGWYFLEVSYPDGCIAKDSVLVDIENDIPIANAGPDHTLTCVIEEINLSGTTNISGTNVLYEWQDNTGNILSREREFMVNQPGNYYLQVIDGASNCKSQRDEITVHINKNMPDGTILSDPGNILNCIVKTLTLQTLQENHVTYRWTSKNEDFYSSIKVIIDSGYVSLYSLDTLSGCDTVTGINIEDYRQFPFVTLESPDSIDCWSPIVTLRASDSQHTLDLQLKWTNENKDIINDQDYSIDVSNTGMYYFTLRDTMLGCETTDSVFVENNTDFPTVEAGVDQILDCGNSGSTTLEGNIGNTGNNNKIEWSSSDGNLVSGTNTLTPIVNETGIYQLFVTNMENGCKKSDTVFIDFDNGGLTLAYLEADDVVCKGEANGSIFITDIQGGTPPYQYYVNGQLAPSQMLLNLPPGNYSLMIVDSKDCSMDTSFTILDGIEFHSYADSLLEIEFGDKKTIYVLVDIPEDDISSIEWTPADNLSCNSCLITEIEGIESTDYQVIITDINGCTSLANIKVIVDKDINIFVPNSFSPNGDGTNDWFTIYADKSVQSINYMKIFNRWGGLVFSNKNFPTNYPEYGWNGTHLGKELNPAVFVYMIEVLLIDGSTKVISGDISLVK